MNDTVKPGRGISGNRGAGYTDNVTDPWTVQPDCAPNERSYSRLDNDNGGDQWMEPRGSENVLRSKDSPWNAGAATRDIWDDTCGNGDVNSGFSGPIRYGVNKSQG